MKQDEFWEQVQRRVKENQQISQSGLPAATAQFTEWIGLRFWLVGAAMSLLMTGLLWSMKYDSLMRAVRVMIWR